jgi:pimeloyl-ACP methyl ester carboxylesterase
MPSPTSPKSAVARATRVGKAALNQAAVVTQLRPTPDTSDPVETLLAETRYLGDRLNDSGHSPVLEFDGKFVDVGQRRVFLRETPNAGEPKQRQAVYLHGLGGSARNWTDLMYLLEPTAGGIAPDLPGFGRSPMPEDQDYGQAALARTAINLIEDRYLKPIDLFGNSMGGAVAIRVAARRPDLVRSLTLISPALPDLKPRLSTAPLLAMAVPGLREVSAKLVGSDDPAQAVDRMHELCYLDPSCVHPQRRDIQVEETRWRLARKNAADPIRLAARGLGKAFLPGHPGNIWTLAAKVTCPTLVVFGSHDKLVDPRHATRAAQVFSHGRVVTLRTGHVAQLEDPARVAKMVLTMWAETYDYDAADSDPSRP